MKPYSRRFLQALATANLLTGTVLAEVPNQSKTDIKNEIVDGAQIEVTTIDTVPEVNGGCNNGGCGNGGCGNGGCGKK